jgi:hypothetical protein
MGKKARTTLTIDRDVLRTAKKLGINVSQYCENALIEAIEKLRSPKTMTNGGKLFLNKDSCVEESSWCSGRDLNPGLRLERPEYLVHANRA